MAQKMKPVPFRNLLEYIFKEMSLNNSIFGIHKKNFFRKRTNYFYSFNNSLLETPFGPAAGPHTQLAQNIITSYLVGGRFIELKTVQILDELEIEKPCIDVADEGYNVEWSQELTLDQSFDEYLKSWIIIHLLKNFFSLSDKGFDGFIFNMSVGYNLEGIRSQKVDVFIEKMKNAKLSNLFNQYLDDVLAFFESNKVNTLSKNFSIDDVLSNINAQISNNVTLSTMHGCPSSEIEDITKYLIAEKNLNTFVKLNPTLLGYERVREILDKLGYTYIALNKEGFEHDLKFDEAISMIKRISDFAREHNKNFGIKLSNTLGVINTKNLLPGKEMYMSGRSLFPLTINLAFEIAREIGEDLHISYSGGANILNAKKIIDCGIYPVTFATELLKPGGYLRLFQIVDNFEDDIKFNQDISSKINLQKLKVLCDEALEHPYYRKNFKEVEMVKIGSRLPVFDCYVAPCEVTCPIHQDVSEYVFLNSEGKFEEAFEVIIEKNPLPHITGYICDHQCMTKCNRWDYDYPVLIRDIKKFVTEKSFENYLNKFKLSVNKNRTGTKVAVIGSGPAGLSVSYFLSRGGFDVTIFEKTDKAGGTVRHTIPKFRIPQDVIDKDIEFVKMHGVKVIYNSPVDLSIEDLKGQGFKYIFIGIGAEIPNELNLKNFNKVLDALDFLKRFNKNEKFNLGKNVIVIGGGNSAMDAARAAKRVEGVENVTILYRRTIKYMPADKEELDAAISDGVKILELLQPIEFDGEILKCQKMQLSDYDEDGRQKSIPIENQFIELSAHTVITAIGERTDLNFLRMNKIQIDENYKVITNPETNETSIENVFIGGDALRGPATVVEAIADGKKVAETILKKEKIQIDFDLKKNYKKEMNKKAFEIRGKLDFNTNQDLQVLAAQCLLCDAVCNKCVEVCPNRANISIPVQNENFKDLFQIVHIDSLCNECGNCETFCPYDGKPYKNKFTIFSNPDEFEQNNNPGFYLSEDKTIKIRLNDGKIQAIAFENEKDLVEKINYMKSNGVEKFYSLLETIIKNYEYLIYH